MEITLNYKKIELVEPEHVQKNFLQETKYMLKKLPDAVASSEIVVGIGAAASAFFIPLDSTSKIILGSISAAALLSGVLTNELKIHYNKPQSAKLFGTEFRSYVEKFVKKKFKLISKLEKAKKHANEQKLRDVEHQQIHLIQDTANVLLNYVDEHNQVIEQIRKLYDQTIFENQYQADDKFVLGLKTETAFARTPIDANKYYVLKILYDNLQAFTFCNIETKKKIISHMFDYEQHLASDAVVDDYMKSHDTTNVKTSDLKTIHKIDMEEEDRDKDIFNELYEPFDYYYFLRDDISNVIDNVNKFEKEVKLEEHLNNVVSQMIGGIKSSNDKTEDICDGIQK